MNLNPIKVNMTELDLGNGTRVLFSYRTPVAARILTPKGMEYHVTDRFYSVTTSRHINNWMPKEDRIEHSQEYFDSLIVGDVSPQGDK